MKMIYGTSNSNKINDINKIIEAHGENFEVLSLKDIKFNKEIIENGETFEENSEIKAKAVKEYCDENDIEYDIITTDDSGICVECLNGKPGVHSSRYAGPNATQEQMINKLLEDIAKTNDKERNAMFVTVLTSFLKDNTKIVTRGECKGKVAKKAKTLGGLTYSPIFIPQGYDVPMSELTGEEYKKAHNHRDKAFAELLKKLKEI